MTRQEEHLLLERVLSGDRQAAEELVRAHQGSLFAYMLRMTGRADVAEDIVQDAFVRALTNIERFDPRFRFSTWLFTIAKRLYVNACQKHRPAYDSAAVGDAEGRSAHPGAPAMVRESQQGVRAALDFALASLSIEQREVIVLFHQLNWPISIIAEHLRMPEGTVKSHLHRGRRKMREAIESHEEHSAHVGEVWA